MNDEPTIAEATGTATYGARAKDIERAMAEAVAQAYVEGVTDPDEIRRRQLEARAKFKTAP